jgi:OOP family OmpA-OmpF porin
MPTPYVVPYAVVGAGFQHYNIRPQLARGQGAAFDDQPVRDPYEAGFDSEGNTFYREIDEPYRYRSFDGDFLIVAGGGAKFLLTERFGVRFDARWLFSVGEGGEDDGVPTLEDPPGYSDLFHHVQVGGSVFVILGGGIGPDADGDGIPNRDDQCRDEAEDKDGFEDEDGCPDLDNDGDGIPDTEDKCIGDPEDKDGFEDEDGCPDLDNDGDGILDARDECPMKPEDDDGFEDKDGCPDLDNDLDGLLDVDDQCPNAPENFNSYLDTDGCPDEIPDDLREFAGAIPAIQFELGSARLKRSALPLLRKAARALQRYSDLRVEIQGHASSDGDDDANMALSQGRVESVREFLIVQGIDPDRLIARGYGETKPIADNLTEVGRRANRRVEFKLFR